MPATVPLPALATVRVELDFPLRSKSNYRRGPKSGAWSTNSDFEQALGVLALSNRPPEWQLGDRERPLAERPVVAIILLATTLLDAANIAKSVTDAFEGVLYHNDASVRSVLSLTTRTKTKQRAVILGALLSPGASWIDMHAASSLLLEKELNTAVAPGE